MIRFGSNSVCEKAGEWKTALELFNKLIDLKLQPNVLAFTALLGALAKGEQTELALSFFRSMKRMSVTPDYIVYRCGIRSVKCDLRTFGQY